MADAAAATVESPAKANPGQGSSMKMMIIVGAGALVLGLGGAFAAFKFMGGSHEAAQAKAGGAEQSGAPAAEAKATPAVFFDLDPFIVNLADAPDVRYLKLTVKLDLDKAETKEELTARLPQIRDAILVLLTSKDAATLRSTQGKTQLRDEITSRVNGVMPRSVVKTAYFTEFVIQ